MSDKSSKADQFPLWIPKNKVDVLLKKTFIRWEKDKLSTMIWVCGQGDDAPSFKGLEYPKVPERASCTYCKVQGKAEDLCLMFYYAVIKLGSQQFCPELSSAVNPTVHDWSLMDPTPKLQQPFSAQELAEFYRTYNWPAYLPVKHGDSGVWAPLATVLSHFESLLNHDNTNSQGRRYEPVPAKVFGLQEPPAPPPRVAPAAVPASAAPQMPAAAPSVDDSDVKMLDVGLFVDAVRHIRASSFYKKSLEKAICVPIDFDAPVPQDAVTSISLPTPMEDIVYETPGLAVSVSASPERLARHRVYLVLDTNVLLTKDGLGFLLSMQETLRRSAAASLSTPGQAPPSPIVAVVPWIVLRELDGLKDMAGENISRAARAALSSLREALQSGSGFFRGQSWQEFREASKDELPYEDLVADDRVLQCGLQLHKVLHAKALSRKEDAAFSSFTVAFVSDDNGVAVKAISCGLPAIGSRELGSAVAQAVGSSAPEVVLVNVLDEQLRKQNVHPPPPSAPVQVPFPPNAQGKEEVNAVGSNDPFARGQRRENTEQAQLTSPVPTVVSAAKPIPASAVSLSASAASFVPRTAASPYKPSFPGSAAAPVHRTEPGSLPLPVSSNLTQEEIDAQVREAEAMMDLIMAGEEDVYYYEPEDANQY